MKYSNVHKATFIDRPNRFIAHVMLKEDGKEDTEKDPTKPIDTVVVWKGK